MTIKTIKKNYSVKNQAFSYKKIIFDLRIFQGSFSRYTLGDPTVKLIFFYQFNVDHPLLKNTHNLSVDTGI